MRKVYEEGASELKTDENQNEDAQRKLLLKFITALYSYITGEWQAYIDSLSQDELALVTDKEWHYVITVLYNS
ncbi:hypothetical protein BKA66DRAFT_455251 [Pyrenochaeta sp. MPI-SDFR-AT-0127]|nr:hypothetical protein BKA66DRAFT_455251 [Pyrenochaeta sp. MPI-SDFR-AT-0127]